MPVFRIAVGQNHRKDQNQNLEYRNNRLQHHKQRLGFRNCLHIRSSKCGEPIFGFG